jgi:RimJ/RimL family protein N-acetyltransferase
MPVDYPRIIPPVELLTERLRLRPWCDADRAPFGGMNADERVMQYFPSVITQEQTDGVITRVQGHFDTWGWGFWAAELRATGEFIGFIGLLVPRPDIPAYPCVEVGWRLAPQFWGKGYATEGAAASLDFAFDRLALESVVAFVVTQNQPSRAVMHRLGMHNQEQNFVHPAVGPDSRYPEHCLYRIGREQWLTNRPNFQQNQANAG